MAQKTVGYMGFALNDCDTITGSILMEMLTRFCIFSLVFTEAALLHNSVSSVPYTTKKNKKKSKEEPQNAYSAST